LRDAAAAVIKEKGAHARSQMPGKFESLADDKLERAIVERLQALGLLAHLPESDTRISGNPPRLLVNRLAAERGQAQPQNVG